MCRKGSRAWVWSVQAWYMSRSRVIAGQYKEKVSRAKKTYVKGRLILLLLWEVIHPIKIESIWCSDCTQSSDLIRSITALSSWSTWALQSLQYKTTNISSTKINDQMKPQYEYFLHVSNVNNFLPIVFFNFWVNFHTLLISSLQERGLCISKIKIYIYSH